MDEAKVEMVPEPEVPKKALRWTIATLLLIPLPIAVTYVLVCSDRPGWRILLLLLVPGVVCGHVALRRVHKSSRNRVHRGVLQAVRALGYTVLVLWLLCLGEITGPSERAYRAACKNNLKQIGLAMHMYSTDYDGWFPVGPEGTDSSYALGILAYSGITYLINVETLICPITGDSVGHWRVEGNGRSAA